jgi:hypothetical protein
MEIKMGRVGREPKLACERRGANGLAVCQPIGTRLLNRNTHPTLRAGTADAELLHAELERRAVHSQARGRTVWSR